IIQDYSQGKLVYPGSTEIWRASECEDYKRDGKGFYVVDLGGDEPDIQAVNLEGVRPFITDSFNVSELDDRIEVIKNDIHLCGKKPLLSLSISGKSYDTSAVHNRVNSAFRDMVLYLKSTYVTEDEAADVSVSRKFDIPCLIRESLKKKNPRSADFAVDLFLRLSSDNLDGARQIADEFYRGEAE
ncbi:MAG: hypothetical protein U9Q22_02970, partial [Candidatus Altiarchaeota archaeon]|nr:hypothetical protein [Candidatus Altiarchaeota archaeon]